MLNHGWTPTRWTYVLHIFSGPQMAGISYLTSPDASKMLAWGGAW